MTATSISMSIDMDNLWSYMKIHGDQGWESFPSYMDVLVEILREQFRTHGLTVTVFIVGQDAALDKNHNALASLIADGHEVGNHSFSHEPWFHEYSREKVVQEISLAEEHIERVTGKRPRGFRGPGFSLSRDTLDVLKERNYLYDASTFPTYLGPLARAYYFLNSGRMTKEEREKRKKLFGNAKDGLRPNTPYVWDNAKPLVEIPVTTMPLVRLPIHMSYLGYLATFSTYLSKVYLKTALRLCHQFGVEPSFLLHPLDFLGSDRIKELSFFPGMKVTTEAKLRIFGEVMNHIKSLFVPVTIEEYVTRVLHQGGLKSRVFE